MGLGGGGVQIRHCTPLSEERGVHLHPCTPPLATGLGGVYFLSVFSTNSINHVVLFVQNIDFSFLPCESYL